MTAHDDLREALRAALDARQTIIPCFPPAPPWWIAEDAAQRAHAPRCQRTRPPILRLSWQARPEAWCPECGRTAPADDTRAGAA